MQNNRRIGVAVTTFGAAASLSAILGCESSSHKSASYYEYSNEPTGRPASAQPVVRDEVREHPVGSDYEMVSPGEMVAPGEMVSPGRPVVEPRPRNP